MRRRNPPEQRGFTRVRITHQACVRNRSQLENKIPRLAFFPLRILARGTVARTLEMDIAFPALAAVAEDKLFVRLRKIGNLLKPEVSGPSPVELRVARSNR